MKISSHIPSIVLPQKSQTIQGTNTLLDFSPRFPKLASKKTKLTKHRQFKFLKWKNGKRQPRLQDHGQGQQGQEHRRCEDRSHSWAHITRFPQTHAQMTPTLAKNLSPCVPGMRSWCHSFINRTLGQRLRMQGPTSRALLYPCLFSYFVPNF